jgi:hypothetical protein
VEVDEYENIAETDGESNASDDGIETGGGSKKMTYLLKKVNKLVKLKKTKSKKTKSKKTKSKKTKSKRKIRNTKKKQKQPDTLESFNENKYGKAVVLTSLANDSFN